MADTEPLFPRSAGVLLHPTSLPGPYGIGDLGPAARDWVDTLAAAGQSYWQILPLSPTGYGDSPYQSFSAFAGNAALVSPELLARDGLLTAEDLRSAPSLPEGRADYDRAGPFKGRLLKQAWERFRAGRADTLRDEFDAFRRQKASWLDDYALFMALKDAHGGANWRDWPAPLRRREPEALAEARRSLAEQVGQYQFQQFLFFRQWRAVKEYANSRGVRLIGDAPIFVSADSADVWANPEIFLLDEQRRPTAVAGVPPDYFSPTGQLWGNPLYNWDALKQTGYGWWVNRIRTVMEKVDLVRLDHFRGFAAAWHVPAGEETAVNGRWVPGPGADLFETLRAELGGLPIIAEDLGEITPDVYELRDRFGLPGMKVLHFAFGETAANPFLPHNYERNAVAYTGTHDNDTTLGWYQHLDEGRKDHVRRYLARPDDDIVWNLIRLAWASVANLAVVPAQDVLELGSEARMNFPGRPEGNWRWRLLPGQFGEAARDRLAEMTELYGRAPAANSGEGNGP